ncbi:MAG: hypothetical protein WKG32_04015 [Gemmatimonadaceae bacterium]
MRTVRSSPPLRTLAAVLAVPLLATRALPAQAPAPPGPPLPEAGQVASAVLPLPAEFRSAARVLGYRAGNTRLVTLREGAGPFVCLASDPAVARFHVACYHQSLEPFMARGRALRAQGVTGDRVDSTRFAEVRAGKLAMPRQPAALYSLTGPAGSFDPATGVATGARQLFVIYIAGATAASTGLAAQPAEGTPWIMFPGTPKAHIMFVPRM